MFLKNFLLLLTSLFLFFSCELKKELIGGDTNLSIVVEDGTNDFGNVTINSTKKLNFRLVNLSNFDLNINKAESESLLTENFYYTNNTFPGENGTCGSILNSGTSCLIELSFSPDTVGLKNGKISISYTNETEAGISTYPIKGTGINVISYTISYDANGATSGTVPAPQIKNHGENLELASNSEKLSKNHLVFSGWSTQADGNGINYAAGGIYDQDQNITLYARWLNDPKTLTINFNGNGAGNILINNNQACSSNCVLSYESNPNLTITATANSNSNFISLSGSCTSTPCNLTLDSNKIITVNFSLKTYQITLSAGPDSQNANNNGWTWSTNNYTKTFNHGAMLGNLPIPSNPSFDFEGWYPLSNGGGQIINSATTVNSVKTYYAYWSDSRDSGTDTHKVRIEITGNGSGSFTSNPNGIVCPPVIGDGAAWCHEFVTDTTITLTAYPAASSTFIEWVTSPCSNTSPCSFNVTSEQTIEANFKLKTYDITYDGNNQTSGFTPQDQVKNYGVSILLQSNDGSLSKNNHIFGGWNTISNGSGTNYNEGQAYTGNANLTLYAKWIPTYTITYNANGGTGQAPAPQTKTHNIDINLSENTGNLKKNGVAFGGWNTNAIGNGTTYNEGQIYTENTNLTLYAMWLDCSGNYYIGCPGPGTGIIFYDKGNNDNGWRYLEVNIPRTTEKTWQIPPTSTMIGTYQTIGQGKYNTQQIIDWVNAQSGRTAPAAQYCSTLTTNGLNDWFLPSKNELIQLYNKRGLIDIYTGYYWTSSEFNPTQVTNLNFLNGNTAGPAKNVNQNVMCIRQFQ